MKMVELGVVKRKMCGAQVKAKNSKHRVRVRFRELM